jgi:hypothetical protein
MNWVMTPMFRAEPWLNCARSAGRKEFWVRPSKPAPKTIAGSVQVPKLNVARFATPPATLQAFNCASHCPTPPASAPELAASAQLLCWTEHERWIAAPLLISVVPSTAKGRPAPAVKMTGGAGPPRVPVKVWTLIPEVGLAAAGVAVAAVSAATVIVTGTGQALPVALAVETDAAGADAAGATGAATLTPATAAVISAAVASFTNRFCVKIQPTGSFWSSQELPFPVASAV